MLTLSLSHTQVTRKPYFFPSIYSPFTAPPYYSHRFSFIPLSHAWITPKSLSPLNLTPFRPISEIFILQEKINCNISILKDFSVDPGIYLFLSCELYPAGLLVSWIYFGHSVPSA